MPNKKVRVATIVGARPQFIKAAALSHAFLRHGGFEEILVHTGQHHDFKMSEIFFRELGIPEPRHHLGIHGGGHGAMTGRMLIGIEQVLLEEKPDWLLVYGDTNSTLAGALAAAKLQIPIAHVEAGLRSFNRTMPEETNRILTDHVSRLLFCPTETAISNLQREGIEHGVHMVGDVMYDTVLLTREPARLHSEIVSRLGLVAGNYAVATVHRAENTDDPEQLNRIISYLHQESERQPIVLPLHPRTAGAASRAGIALDGLHVIEPLGYLDMSRLLADCACVFTDSGGVQKEAYFHGKPCITLRGETEWLETITCGWNRLWHEPEYAPRRPIRDYGDGHAAERIATLMGESLR